MTEKENLLNKIIFEIDSVINNIKMLSDMETKEITQSQVKSEFDILKELLNSEDWPEANNPSLICDPNSETDKTERGQAIIELIINETLKDKKFLDMGCGEGHTTLAAVEQGVKLAIGYDIKHIKKPTTNNLLFTTNFKEVTKNAPYDVILIFDVIDHLVNDTAIEFLKKAKDALDDNGLIYLRTHPFISRDGLHLSHTINKAYIHLVFTPDELKNFVSRHEENYLNVIYPIKTYKEIIEASGLKIKKKQEVINKPEDFFKSGLVLDRIKKNTKTNNMPEFQMSIQFIDYILTK